MINVLLYMLVVAAVIWVLARVFLRGPDHSMYDEPKIPNIDGREKPSAEHAELARLLDALNERMSSVSFKERNFLLREVLDDGLLGAPVDADALGINVEPLEIDGVPGEWVIAPGADPDKRLLYLHGGGFFAGSPTSARMITAGLGRRTGAVVLSIDYRLMPENGRHDSVVDTESAYRWMLDNGPAGNSPAQTVLVAGDSAGGNLALVVSASARDNGWRSPDGVVAFAPSTDSTILAPSYRRNIDTDPILGPALGPLARLPATLVVLLGWIIGRVNPSGPRSSPLFGNLAGLPPTLVQASDCEMLIDDARRYVNKARSQGSTAELQVWPGTVHVFQMLGHIIPEADEALDKAADFLATPHSSGRKSE